MKHRIAAAVLGLAVALSLMGTVSLPVLAADDYPFKDAAYQRYSDADIDPWKFYYRECTSFVAWRLNNDNFDNFYGGVQWGNGGEWGPAARSLGIRVDDIPAVGAVYWQIGGIHNNSADGHVGWVKEVLGNAVVIEHYARGSYIESTVPANYASGYIHIHDLESVAAQPEDTAPPELPPAMVETDKEAYLPGETVTIFPSGGGAAFYTLRVERDGETIMTDDSGFTGSKLLQVSTPGLYEVTVSAWPDWSSHTDAQCSFLVEEAGIEVHFSRSAQYLDGQFTDVTRGFWFLQSVVDAFELGLMKGNADATFLPEGSVTLAEAVTMAARIHSIYSNGSEQFRSASKGEEWYQPYADYALENGLLSASLYRGGLERAATRVEFAEILAASLPEQALPAINAVADGSIPDISMTDACAPFVYLLYRAGILAGDDSGAFQPRSNITRAEAAAIVSRMADSDSRLRLTPA